MRRVAGVSGQRGGQPLGFAGATPLEEFTVGPAQLLDRQEQLVPAAVHSGDVLPASHQGVFLTLNHKAGGGDAQVSASYPAEVGHRHDTREGEPDR